MILELFEFPQHPEIHITAIDEQVETPEGCLPENERLYKYAMALQLLLSNCNHDQVLRVRAEPLRFLMRCLSQALVSSKEEIRQTAMVPGREIPLTEIGKNSDLEGVLLHLIGDLADAGHYEELGGVSYVGGLKLGPLGQQCADIAFSV